MPESERSPERLAKEAQVLLGGGTASTARTIGFASFYILDRPRVRARLRDELGEVMADWPRRVPSWVELERVPYLQAVIKESLRLSYGVMHRLPRISPDLGIQYGEFTIPPGVCLHCDPIATPDTQLIWFLTCRLQSACPHTSCTLIQKSTPILINSSPSAGWAPLIQL